MRTHSLSLLAYWLLMVLGLFTHSFTHADAPHDIGANQRLWLDGLDVNGTDFGNGGGTNPTGVVNAWRDKSPNSFIAGDAVSFSVGNRTFPIYAASQGVSFDGVRDILEIPSGIYGNGTTVSASDYFMVATTRRRQNSFVFLQGPTFNTGNRISSHIPWSDNIIYWDQVCCGVGRLTASWPGSGSVFNRLYVWNFRAVSGSSQQIWRDGASLATKTTSATYIENTIDNFYVGGAENGSGHNHDGIISELIVYSRRLNDVERRILLSYLTAKHNTPGGVGTESRYSNTAGFRFHLGGIGQESSGTLPTSTSAGLTLTGGSWLANGRYLLAGLPSLNPVSGSSSSDLPAGTTTRSNRVWFLDNTGGGTGNANLSFNFGQIGLTANSGENWQLLYRADTSSPFTTLQTVTYDGSGAISFNQSNPVDGYYAIGRATNVDLDISKTSSVITDGISASNPKSLPGAIVQYTVLITNNLDAPDSDSVVITEALPSDVDLFVGDLSAGAPFEFVEGSPGCTFTVPFVSLSSTSDAIEFLDSSDTPFTPVPDADGFDSSVRSFRISPIGQLAAYSGTGSQPSCSLSFNIRIR